jgi:DNA polymerase III alpha subunit
VNIIRSGAETAIGSAPASGIANIVVWPKLLEQSRRVVLGASMMAINGRIQREGEVVHLVAPLLIVTSI